MCFVVSLIPHLFTLLLCCVQYICVCSRFQSKFSYTSSRVLQSGWFSLGKHRTLHSLMRSRVYGLFCWWKRDGQTLPSWAHIKIHFMNRLEKVFHDSYPGHYRKYDKFIWHSDHMFNFEVAVFRNLITSMFLSLYTRHSNLTGLCTQRLNRSRFLLSSLRHLEIRHHRNILAFNI